MENPKETLKSLPHNPGIYIYKNKAGEVIYVGKAKDLKRRVSQYFQRDDAVGAKTSLLVSNIASIEAIETASEFDALLLEANLIHEYQPKYNVVLKDDKSPLYVLLTTSEQLPRVITLRKSDMPKRISSKDTLYGPFQSAHIVRSMLRQVRSAIPYCTQKRRTGLPCFYTHIGLCYPCPSEIVGMADSPGKDREVRAYRRNIFRLKAIFSGKSSEVQKELETEMRESADQTDFERAASLRKQLENLHYLLSKRYDPSIYTSSTAAVEDIYRSELNALRRELAPYYPEINFLERIECMDISNTSGTNATGSLVVLTNGRKDTAQYRRFRIRDGQTPNDFAMMAEIVTRRLRHEEWQYPDLLVIDGGKGQVSAALHVIQAHFASVGKEPFPVIGLAKRYEEIIIPIQEGRWKILRLGLASSEVHVLERVRDEAHRFAIEYHRTLRAKRFV